MKNNTFLRKLAFITLPLVIFFIILHLTVPAFQPYSYVSWISVVFFTVFSWFVSIFGEAAAKSENNNDFIRFIMMVIMGKLFFSIFIVVGYVMIVQPENRYVVLPFLPIYIIYAIFETSYLMKLAKK